MFYLTSFLLLIASLFHTPIEASPSYQIIEDEAKTPILNPAFASTKSLKIRLDNELEVYLISDPSVDKSSAALSVGTGSWEDPKEHPGMAHFLEHLLFLGTEKYPEESSYQRYISQHGGQYNAFTGSDFTTYLFSIEHKGYPEAIDRLSHFFKTPLFNPSGVDRELNAINQEHAKNLDSDDWRGYFVLKELASPDHPYHAFATGNKESLKNVTQDELIKWYQSHYSANRMKLITVSNLPLDQLCDLVVQAFSDVPNHHLSNLNINLPIIQEALKGHMVYVEPVKNIRTLSIIWDLPPSFADMRDTKPHELISYVLQHQGRSSLIAELKRAKLAENISSGGQILNDSNMQFAIDITLTDEGVKNIDEVIYRTYEAIANLKLRGIPQYLFDEIQTMNLVNYQYQSRQDAFSGIKQAAILSRREPLSTFPEKSCLLTSFDPKAVKDLLNELAPGKAIYTLMAPEILTNVPFEKKEQWMHVPYTVKAIDSQSLNDWADAISNPRIDIPSHNPFIPEQLAMQETSFHQKEMSQVFISPQPSLVIDNEQGKVFASHDLYYGLPEIYWTFYIQTPAVTAEDPATIVLAEIYTSCLMDDLRSYTYPAAIAGLNFSVATGANGVQFTVSGYSDKAEELFIDLITQIVNFRPIEELYKTYKDILLRQYKSFDNNMPYLQAKEQFYNIIYKNFVTNKAKVSAAKKVTFAKFKSFVTSLYEVTSLDGMLYGNMPDGQPAKITDFLIKSLSSVPYPESEHLAKEVITLPSDSGPFYVEKKISSQANAALLTIEMAPYSLKSKAASVILMQAMKQPFFSTLRTKQQTGYIVSSTAEEHELHLFNSFIVQSNTHDGKDLLSRFELFIEEFMQEISKTEITPDRFETIRHSILSQLKQPPKSIAEMGGKLYTLATEHAGDFQSFDKLIQTYEEITYFEFLEYAHQMMGKQNKRRLGVLMKGTLSSDTSIEYTKINSSEALQKLK